MTSQAIAGIVVILIVVAIIIFWLVYDAITKVSKVTTIKYSEGEIDLKSNKDFQRVEAFCKNIEKRVDKLEAVADEILTDIRGIKVRLNSRGL